MKNLYFALIIVFISGSSLFGQFIYSPNELCTPDTSFAHENGNIYPEAYHERLNPNKGILDSACINTDYSFVFTAVVPDSFPSSLGTVKLDYIKVLENGVIDVPKGLKYSCNPPNCNFVSGTIGCLDVYGKPDASNEIKVYDLKLKIEISVAEGLIIVEDTLPAYLTDSAHYYLPLFEEGSPNCQPLSVYNVENDYSLSISPNPAREYMSIILNTPSTGNFDYSLVDLYGKSIYRKRKFVNNNQLTFSEDLSGLKPGVYFLKTEFKRKVITKKIIVL